MDECWVSFNFCIYLCILGQNICRFFYFFAHFAFSRSETELQYYHQKVNEGVALRVTERLTTLGVTNLGTFMIIDEMPGFDSKYGAFQEKRKSWQILVKDCENSGSTHPIEKYISRKVLNFSPTFCSRLSKKSDFHF